MRETTSLLDIVPVIPVVVVHDAADAVPIANALVEGGLPIIELTLRTPAAIRIQHPRERFEIRPRPPMHNHLRIVKQLAAFQYGIHQRIFFVSPEFLLLSSFICATVVYAGLKLGFLLGRVVWLA